MKILVVGAGAIGGYYGARLLQAGAQVSFLVRPQRAASLASNGLQVRSELGDFSGAVAAVVREDLKPVYDLIVLSCKAYDLDAAMHDIGPAVGPDTVILPFLNGMAVYDLLDARFGRDRVLGGAAYIAVMLDQDRVIRHFGANDVVVVGSRSERTAHAAERFFALISASQGSRKLSPDVTQALWNKWVMLGTGALMTCLMRGTVADILATRDGERLMKQAIGECCAVAAAEGHALSAEDLRGLEARLLDTRSTWAASMMRDIAQDAPRLEAQAIVGDLIVRAERRALDLPLARTAYCHLQVYEGQHARAQMAPRMA
ncbi:ketopantoate reductase [Comamonas sp. BIGb0124]|uniref:2-dehydropantoate 2-reductase n=1 Tax=Comamonas sp. BIGb0124 TaxID=2485130 RepID=UPI000F475083|nr:2-dehydropantoate 2-reductase [Comamonas sp. BIGb0124]ROR24724.1 ketopantoate reductase [Comamonas sp. BIGb0124]